MYDKQILLICHLIILHIDTFGLDLIKINVSDAFVLLFKSQYVFKPRGLLIVFSDDAEVTGIA